MALVRLDDISLDFGDQKIFVGANFALEDGERVCLVGRNGAGKTTLFRLLTGAQVPDQGTVHISPDVEIAELQQAPPRELDLTVSDYVAGGLERVRNLRARYEALSSQTLDRTGLAELEALQRRLDALGGWNLEQRVATYSSELDLPAGRTLGELSGGWRRRVALARALVGQPDLLLLDEPTNHLDIVTIRWLEDVVRGYAGSVVFVTHDRAFVQALATRIVELDRGRLVSFPGDYASFLRRRDEALAAEQRDDARFDKKLAEEEAWIRQGIKARRTRNEGRVRALEAMREQRESRIKRARTAHIHIDEAEDSGRKVLRLHNVTYGYGDEPLIRDFSFKMMRGDRLGLVGNNGVGKSTLLKLMLGQLLPQEGTVKHGTNLKIGYYDPLLQDLDPDKSVAYNVGEGRDYLHINGREHHVVGYLKGFLFSAKRALTPVKSLSGGERNRVLLARLFTRATNLLVLDEPTNDLDVETLEVLESRLAEYRGTLIAVSHDRRFIDNVVTSILAFESDGRIREYVGGFSDWERRGRQLAEIDRPKRRGVSDAGTGRPRERAATKLSYKDQRELDALPGRIEQLEAQVATATGVVTAPDFYDQPFETTRAALEEYEAVKAALSEATERWIELEELRESLAGR